MRKLFSACLFFVHVHFVYAQKQAVSFNVGIDRQNKSFHVKMSASSPDDSVLVKMPAWTPGYYQILNFADNVSAFEAKVSDQTVPFKHTGRNGWKFKTGRQNFVVEYDVKASRAFVAVPVVDNDHAYIAPTGVFMYADGNIQMSAAVAIDLPEGWTAATGLEPAGKNKFTAPNFDILFDSPILLGALGELPSFKVKDIPHRFIGYKLGDFDKASFMNDLKKIVEVSTDMMGDIPYKHYTFIAIGPGPGGIEHLNSTTFGFSGESLKSDAGKKQMYTFLAHEYFHHFNVKRIRPIELGPFDYDKENRTNMLWVSEGFTVYYDLMIARRAGLLNDNDLMEGLHGRLLGFENKPGRLYQSATQASYNTWSDGPFGRSDDEVNKTVSVYDKGAILGLMLDFAIRNATQNKKSLDDVMRSLYKEFYQEKKRGFRENEFQNACEQIAGIKFTELFEYVSTVKPIDYRKYFSYGGLDIDTQPKTVQGAWLGISVRTRNDSLVVTNVEYESPAWNAGIRRRNIILQMNGAKVQSNSITPMLQGKQNRETLSFNILQKGEQKNLSIHLTEKIEPDFKITPLINPSELQKKIFDSWRSQSK